MYINRYIENSVVDDLEKKMVFISGPRQVGKTALSKMICKKIGSNIRSFYMNWDDSGDRENIMKERFPFGPGILILDEIHKYVRWRQVVKGLFDKRMHELKIIVTIKSYLMHA